MPITRSGVAISLWTGVASEGWVILPLSQCSYDSTTSAYEGIAKAIGNCGYEPKRIDKKEHSNKIDYEIIAEIVVHVSWLPISLAKRERYVVAFTTRLGAGGICSAEALIW